MELPAWSSYVIESSLFAVNNSNSTDPSSLGLKIGGVIFATILSIGSVVALVPQIINLLRYRNTKGISYLTLIFGNITAFCSVINAVILNYFTMEQCATISEESEKDFFVCYLKFCVVLQSSLLWLMYFINIVFYIIFFRFGKGISLPSFLKPSHSRSYGSFTEEETISITNPNSELSISDLAEDKEAEQTILLRQPSSHRKSFRSNSLKKKDLYDIEVHDEEQDEIEDLIDFFATKKQELEVKMRSPTSPLPMPTTTTQDKPKNKTITFLSFIVYLGFLFVTSGLMIIFLGILGYDHNVSIGYAQVIGIGGSILVFVQWTPQIIRTIRSRGAGNFSILTVLILTPGSYVMLFYYIVVTKEDWTYWISFVASGIQQTILLALLIGFETYNCIKKRAKKQRKIENGLEDSNSVSLESSNSQFDKLSEVSALHSVQ